MSPTADGASCHLQRADLLDCCRRCLLRRDERSRRPKPALVHAREREVAVPQPCRDAAEVHRVLEARRLRCVVAERLAEHRDRVVRGLVVGDLCVVAKLHEALPQVAPLLPRRVRPRLLRDVDDCALRQAKGVEREPVGRRRQRRVSIQDAEEEVPAIQNERQLRLLRTDEGAARRARRRNGRSQ